MTTSNTNIETRIETTTIVLRPADLCLNSWESGWFDGAAADKISSLNGKSWNDPETDRKERGVFIHYGFEGIVKIHLNMSFFSLYITQREVREDIPNQCKCVVKLIVRIKGNEFKPHMMRITEFRTEKWLADIKID